MRGTDLDRIAASEPINRATARVMQSGVHWDYEPSGGEVLSAVPLPTRPATGAFDLTGRVFGSLVVLGLGRRDT